MTTNVVEINKLESIFFQLKTTKTFICILNIISNKMADLNIDGIILIFILRRD